MSVNEEMLNEEFQITDEPSIAHCDEGVTEGGECNSYKVYGLLIDYTHFVFIRNQIFDLSLRLSDKY